MSAQSRHNKSKILETVKVAKKEKKKTIYRNLSKPNNNQN